MRIKTDNIPKYVLLVFLSGILVLSFVPRMIARAVILYAPQDLVTVTNLEGNASSEQNSVYLSGIGTGNYGGNSYYGLSLEEVLRDDPGTGFDLMRATEEVPVTSLYSNTPGQSVSFYVRKTPNTWVHILVRTDSGGVEVAIGEQAMTGYPTDASDPAGDGLTYIAFYPYLENSALTAVYLLIYSLVYLCSFLAIYGILYFILYSQDARRIYRQVSNWNYKRSVGFLAVFAVCFVFCALSYYENINAVHRTIMTDGDQEYYWVAAQRAGAGEEGLFSFKEWALRDGASFRGYLYPFLVYLVRTAAAGSDTVAIFILFALNSAVTGLLLAVIMPYICARLSDKKVNCFQFIVFSGFFFCFWRYIAFYVLPELYSIAALFGAIALLLRYVEKPSYQTSFFIGIAVSAAISFRQNFQIIGKVFLLCAAFAIVLRVADRFLPQSFKRPEVFTQIRHWRGLPLIFAGFLLVAFPQALMNFYRGHLSLLAVDYPGAWTSPVQTLVENQAVGSFSLMQGWPHIFWNPLGTDLFEFVYPKIDQATVKAENLVYLALTSPRELLSVMIMRFFLLTDIKFADIYPIRRNHVIFSAPVTTFSIFNYFLWASTIASLFFTRIRQALYQKKELIFFSVLFVFIALLQTLVHVEWRYALPFYFVPYYCVGYKMMGALSKKGTTAFHHQYAFGSAVIAIVFCMMSVSNNIYSALTAR